MSEYKLSDRLKRKSQYRVTKLVLTVFVLLWLGGFPLFLQTLETDAPPLREPDAAIVVLTGSPDRITLALDLLDRSPGAKLFISGVYRGVEVHELLSHFHADPQVFDCCVELGHAALNTVGNAAESAAWIQQGGYDALALVTSHYHMPRALLEFGMALPDHTVTPVPVLPDNPAAWPSTSRQYAFAFLEYNKYIFTLSRFMLWRVRNESVFAE